MVELIFLLVLYLHLGVDSAIMPGRRSYFAAVKAGLSLTDAQESRMVRDTWYMSSHSAPNRRFLEVPASDLAHYKDLVRGKRSFDELNRSNSRCASTGKQAAHRAFKNGIITSEQNKQYHNVFERMDVAKHTTLGCALPTPKKKSAWADLVDIDAEPLKADSPTASGHFERTRHVSSGDVDPPTPQSVTCGVQCNLSPSGEVFACQCDLSFDNDGHDDCGDASVLPTVSVLPLPGQDAEECGLRFGSFLNAGAEPFVYADGSQSLVDSLNSTIASLTAELDSWRSWFAAQPLLPTGSFTCPSAEASSAVGDKGGWLQNEIDKATADLAREVDAIKTQLEIVNARQKALDGCMARSMSFFDSVMPRRLEGLKNEIFDEMGMLFKKIRRVCAAKDGIDKQPLSEDVSELQVSAPAGADRGLHDVRSDHRNRSNVMPMHEFIKVAADVRRRLPHLREPNRPLLAICDVDLAMRLDDGALKCAMRNVFESVDVQTLTRSALLRGMEANLGASTGSLEIIKEKIGNIAGVAVQGYVGKPSQSRRGKQGGISKDDSGHGDSKSTSSEPAAVGSSM